MLITAARALMLGRCRAGRPRGEVMTVHLPADTAYAITLRRPTPRRPTASIASNTRMRLGRIVLEIVSDRCAVFQPGQTPYCKEYRPMLKTTLPCQRRPRQPACPTAPSPMSPFYTRRPGRTERTACRRASPNETRHSAMSTSSRPPPATFMARIEAEAANLPSTC